LEHHQLAAPALWVYEITNVFTKAVHFVQITVEEAKDALEQIMALGVQIIPLDETQSNQAFDQTIR
jgi:predicted nucleic acid-binding protein